jgi:transcriptional regulator with XRE-family HTH domain
MGYERQAKVRRPVSRLELIRRNAGFTQASLADLIGVSRPYISNVEQGWVPPPARQLAFAVALGVAREDLWPPEEQHYGDF